MGTIASQITSLTIVYSTFYSDADQRKHLRHWPVTRKMFPFDDVIMNVRYAGNNFYYMFLLFFKPQAKNMEVMIYNLTIKDKEWIVFHCFNQVIFTYQYISHKMIHT